MDKFRIVVVSLFILLATGTFSAGGQHQNRLKVNDSIPLDPDIKYGRLQNGFTYYIKQNTNPSNKVMIRFAIKAGIFNEETDQFELAHLLEHVAIRGTKHFPEGIWNYLNRYGLKPGKDINAETTLAYTSYQIDNLPANDSELLSNCLLIVRDWANDLLLTPEAIKSEAGAVIAEGGFGDYQIKMQRQQYSMQLEDTIYARIFGRQMKTSIDQFDRDALIRFYMDWYRPDLQCIAVVGDINVQIIENAIIKLFSNLKNPEGARAPKKGPLELTGKNKVIKITSEQSAETLIQVYMKHEGVNYLKTIGDIKSFLIGKLYGQMMNLRLSKIVNRYDPPAKFISSYFEEFLGVMQSLSSNITVDDPKDIKPALRLLMSELERVDRFGFTNSELSRALVAISKDYQFVNKPSSSDLAENYIKHFSFGTAAPNADYKYELINRLLAEITLTDINEKVKDWINDTNRDIVIKAPERHAEFIPDEVEIDQLINEVKALSLNEYKNDDVSLSHLISLKELPEASGVCSVAKIEELGITQLELANGTKVVFYPSNSDSPLDHRIALHGFSPGGYLLYKQDEFTTALSACSIVKKSGVGGVDRFKLNNLTRDSGTTVIPYIDDSFSGILGFSSSDGFKTMLQLMYQYFINPNKDEIAFQDFVFRRMDQLDGRSTVSFEDTIKLIMEGPNYMRPFTKEDYAKIKFDRVYQIYRERFALSAGNFVFVITGDFELERIIDLTVRYIGALPKAVIARAPVVRRSDSFRPNSTRKVVLSDRNATLAEVQLRYTGSHLFGPESNAYIEVLERLLDLRLKKRLRQKEGGIYSWKNFGSSIDSNSRYHFTIGFECAKESVEKMVLAASEEVKELQRVGPTEDEFTQAIALTDSYYNSILNGDGILNYLTVQYKNEQDPKDIIEWMRMLDKVSREDLRSAANIFLSEDNYFEFILL